MKHTQTTKSFLIIAYPFPPIPYSGTYRILRLCKGLVKLGFEIHALSIKIDNKIPNDFDLLAQVPESVHIHRISIIDPWLKYQAWRKKNYRITRFKYLNKIISLLLGIITIPDHQIFWIPFAVAKGYKILKKYKIKTILVSSPPNSSLLIGYFLKCFAKVKFIADLRDPIVGNVAQVNLIDPSDLLSKIEKKVLMRLEKVIVNSANIVITNTETHRKEMETKYCVDKFHTVRNSFDEDDYKGISRGKYARFTISHIGSMYGLRKADILFQAIKRLEGKFDSEPLNLQMLFVGATGGKLEQSISRYGVENYVKVQPPVPHREAIEIMMRSHILLLVKATGEGSYGQIPAKFFEYLGTKNKIFCLGPKESEVAEIMHRLNCGYTIGNDKEEMFSVLRKEYTAFLNGDRFSLDSSITNEFSSYEMVANVLPLIS